MSITKSILKIAFLFVLLFSISCGLSAHVEQHDIENILERKSKPETNGDANFPYEDSVNEKHLFDSEKLPKNCYPRTFIPSVFPYICRCDDSKCPNKQRCYHRYGNNENYKCIKEPGESCEMDNECYTSICSGGVCQKANPSEACEKDSDCHRGRCLPNAATWSVHACTCFQNQDCIYDRQCNAGLCESEKQCKSRQEKICKEKLDGKLLTCDCNKCNCRNGEMGCTLARCPRDLPIWGIE